MNLKGLFCCIHPALPTPSLSDSALLKIFSAWDQAGLDTFRLKDDSFEASDNIPGPDVIASGIIEI